MVPRTRPQTYSEALMSTENGYNLIPSPDGKYLAYVRTGWADPLEAVVSVVQISCLKSRSSMGLETRLPRLPSLMRSYLVGLQTVLIWFAIAMANITWFR